MTTKPPQRTKSLHWSNWNLLLAVPLLILVTPLFNRKEPRLWGMPFFYWSQLAFVLVGIVCVALVYARTTDLRASRTRDNRNPEDLEAKDPQ